MEQIAPGDREAVMVRVAGRVIELWPTRPEYFSAVTLRAQESFQTHRQDVPTLSSPAKLGAPIVVATAAANIWPMNRYRDDPSIWSKAQEMFLASSGRDFSLKELSDLANLWLATFLTSSEYFDHLHNLRY